MTPLPIRDRLIVEHRRRLLALAERDEAIEQRDRARALACRLEEELALIRRALSKAHRL
jgi:hypothetical protein